MHIEFEVVPENEMPRSFNSVWYKMKVRNAGRMVRDAEILLSIRMDHCTAGTRRLRRERLAQYLEYAVNRYYEQTNLRRLQRHLVRGENIERFVLDVRPNLYDNLVLNEPRGQANDDEFTDNP